MEPNLNVPSYMSILSCYIPKVKSSVSVSGIPWWKPCIAFRNQYPLSMKGRNADNVCFPTKEPHRRCDSEAEPVIKVCFTWPRAVIACKQKKAQDAHTMQSDQASEHAHSPRTELSEIHMKLFTFPLYYSWLFLPFFHKKTQKISPLSQGKTKKESMMCLNLWPCLYLCFSSSLSTALARNTSGFERKGNSPQPSTVSLSVSLYLYTHFPSPQPPLLRPFFLKTPAFLTVVLFPGVSVLSLYFVFSIFLFPSLRLPLKVMITLPVFFAVGNLFPHLSLSFSVSRTPLLLHWMMF